MDCINKKMKSMSRTKTFFFFCSILFFMISCDVSSETKADKLYQDDKVDEAIQMYQTAIEDGSETAINKLALLYANEHQPEVAKEWYIKSFNKGNMEATKILENISLKDGNSEDVIMYSKPLADQGDKDVIYSLGSAYYKLKDYKNAIHYFLRDEDNVYNRYVLGLAYYDSGDKKNAEIQWRKAVDLYPSGAINSYNRLLELFKEQNRMDDYEAYVGKY